MRKLASVQEVLALEPIENADRIEVAVINGWRSVVKRGEFAPGDLGVFLEIDSVPPDVAAFSFLWQVKPTEGEEATIRVRPPNFRLRTAKLRGVLSQGLLLPLSAAREAAREVGRNPRDLEAIEHADVTEFLQIEKWEPPPPTGADVRAPFPPYLPKTDEERVQSAPQVLGELWGKPFVITLKLDGASATYTIDPRDDSFHVCARNNSLVEADNPYWRAARRYDLETVLRAQDRNYAVQGEVVGPGVQSNRLGLKETDLFIFNVFDVANARYLAHRDARAWADANGLSFVPVLEEGDAFAYTQDDLLRKAEGKYEGTSNEREGLVIRALSGEQSPTLGGRLSFKAISNRFLLKNGEE